MVARQLILDLSGAPRLDRDDFLVSSSNRAACALIDSWPSWPGPAVLLTGPSGSGKSHLAAMWASEVGATIVQDQLAPGLWNGGKQCVVIEDCDRRRIVEADLFHALNLAKETGGSLLLTARRQPSSWSLSTPDLVSRLRQASAASLAPPDQELLKAVLVKLFSDRQLRVEADVIAYAALHCEQSMEAVNRFVNAIDAAALSANRRITRPLAVATLAQLSAGDNFRRPDQGPT